MKMTKGAIILYMAAKQGLKRLTIGAEKRLTPSEVNRGYFFVTNDKLAIAALGKKFDVAFSRYNLSERHIDSYGRIFVGREILREFKDKLLTVKIDGKNLVVKPVRD